MIVREQLSSNDLERLVEWFSYRMTMDQRRELMADMPLVYSRLAPGAGAESIVGMVSSALANGGRP